MAPGETNSHDLALEVYLPYTLILGTLVTRHERLSNYLNLRSGDDPFILKGARIEDLNGNRLPVDSEEYLLYLREVLFIADLSPMVRTARSSWDQHPIRKEPRRAFLHVSPFWLRGTIYLLPGSTLSDLLMVKNRFIPVTDATLLDHPALAPRTFLVNDTKISCLAADDDAEF